MSLISWIDQLQHTNCLFIGSSHQPLNGGECFYITLGLGDFFFYYNVLKLLQISRVFLNIICMKIVEYPRTIVSMNMVEQSRTISVCIR